MIGQGLSASKNPTVKKTIVRDGLVLRHDYKDRPVELCSSGAADINADADANEYIDVGAIPITTNDVSISAWVYATSFADYGGIFSNRQTESPQPGVEIRTRSSGTKIQCHFDDGNDSTTLNSGALNANQWYHVCAVFDRSDKVFLYIDGVEVDSADISSDTDTCNHSDVAMIGRVQGSATYDFKGYICNVGYWNAALTQAQVKSIMHKDYASLSASEKTSLVSWWNLDSTMVTAKDGGKFGALDSHYGGGSELGSEMWDGANGDTTHWDNYGTENEISSDDGAVKITYKDDSGGYLILLMDDSHLNANLVVGKFYRLTFSTKINNGSVNWTLNEHGEDSYDADALTSTSFITQQIDFLATASQDHFLFPASMDGTEEVWIKDISLKLINGNTGTLV